MRSSHQQDIRKLLLDRIPVLLFLCATLLSGFAAGSVQSEEDSRGAEEAAVAPAQNNPFLRDFFRKMYPRLFRDHRLGVQDQFVERFVDLQIDEFVRNLESDLKQLREDYGRLQHLRRVYLEEEESYRIRNEARHEMWRTLDRIADRSDDVGDGLALIFRGLETERDLPESWLRPDAREDYFAEEVKLLGEQLAEGERLTRGYLLERKNTVHLEDLHGEDMMVRFNWAEHLAKAIRDRLR